MNETIFSDYSLEDLYSAAIDNRERAARYHVFEMDSTKYMMDSYAGIDNLVAKPAYPVSESSLSKSAVGRKHLEIVAGM